MATSSRINLVPTEKPEFAIQTLSEESAKKASELLQENHELHHIFFNEEGFHNHIVHHILSIYALGADPSTLKRMYDENANYQRPAMEVETKVIQEMHDPAKFKEFLGNEKYYSDYLAFFQQEIEKKGWEQVVNEYLFTGDERADDLLVRTFSGFLHPLIHLGFGIEFNQPAIIAEALAQACVHSNWIAPLYLESEKQANKLKQAGKESKTLMQLLEEMQADQKLVESPHWPDGNKVRDGILARAPERMIHHASQYFVGDEAELEKRTAEMIHLVAYFSLAAQHWPKSLKIDFFYMHCVNSSIFFTRFLQLPSLSAASKIRLLEWKARGDLALYVSRGSPALSLDDVINYKPKEQVPPGKNPWPSVMGRVVHHPDDGHSSKLIRALAHGKNVCQKWEDDKELGFELRGDMWDTAGQIVIDSVEMKEGPRWIRGAGFEDAWEKVPDRTAKL